MGTSASRAAIRRFYRNHVDAWAATVLWILAGLFLLRVIGQILVEFLHVNFLPPSEEWMSGTLSYTPLLLSQWLILVLQLRINIDFTRRQGWAYRPSENAGEWLIRFGSVYLGVMVIRYIVRMSVYPHERWTGGCIPIFFHLILALYLLHVGFHHLALSNDAPAHGARPPSIRRWLAPICGWSAVAVGVAAWLVILLLPSILALSLGIRRAEYAVRIERDAGLTTRDRVRLSADVFHPRRASPRTPTLLVRIPYSNTFANRFFISIVGQMWAERGYTVVIQGTRGRGTSSGVYEPLVHEEQDGQATLEWLAQQSWYDGRIGMWGASYFGYTQWVIADRNDPGPTALMVAEASTDFRRMFHPGGATSLKTALYWALMSDGSRDRPPSEEMMKRGLAGFPLVECDRRASHDIQFFNDCIAHVDRDTFWTAIDGVERVKRVRAPVLLMGGWFDPFLPTQLADFIALRSHADPRVARESRLIIGPWAHAETANLPGSGKHGNRNFRLESLAPTLDWFDRHLQGRNTREGLSGLGKSGHRGSR